MPKMTDAEIVCSFMERPDDGRAGNYRWWWRQKRLGILNDECDFFPVELTLDRLHEVEARLAQDQRLYEAYILFRLGMSISTARRCFDFADAWALIHPDPLAVMTALAAVLRPEVEGR